MKKCILSILVLMFQLLKVDAQNLVSNGSFEDTLYCNGLGYLEEVVGWYSPGGSSPDFFSPCANAFGLAGMPYNFPGNQYPMHGSSYVGFATMSLADTTFPIREYREHLTTQLTQTLTIGTRYFVSAYISLSDIVYNYNDQHCASNNVGFRFNTNQYWNEYPANNFAHINFDTIITDTAGWTKMKGSFIADSAYRYLSIGNFFDNAHTTTLCPAVYQTSVYYYLDYVTVSEDSTADEIPTDITYTSAEQFQVKVSPNPFTSQLTLTVSINEPATVSVYNFMGELVLQQRFANTTAINTAQLANGIYFYEVRNGNEVIGKGKVIKQ